ncbi:hypothetical protein [Ursidibacter arcticus]
MDLNAVRLLVANGASVGRLPQYPLSHQCSISASPPPLGSG